MPKYGAEIYLDELEIKIMCAFVSHLYLTDSEMADILRDLADKLDGQRRSKSG